MTTRGGTQSGELELQHELDILHARLAELEAKVKRTHKSGRVPGSEVEVLFSSVGALDCAFELSAIKEVVPAAQLAPLPEAPSWVLGTLNLRGKTIPIIHIGSRMQGERARLRASDLIVIVQTESGSAGLVVTEVGVIQKVRLDSETSLMETPHAAYVVGTFTQKNQARLLLGVHELLRHSALAGILREVAKSKEEQP